MVYLLIIFLLDSTMVLLLTCQVHQQPLNKICGMHDCSTLLCDHCLSSHFQLTHHHLVICLNQSALNYFQHFTQYIHMVMVRWIAEVQKKGFGAVFAVSSKDGSLCEGTSFESEMTAITLKVMEEHRNVMACNNSFVSTNADTPQLYHPMFMKDIYNLIVHSWLENAQIILIKIADRISLFIRDSLLVMPEISFRGQLVVQIQKQREEILKQYGKLVHDLAHKTERSAKDCSQNQVETNDRSAGSIHELPTQAKQVSQFHINNLPLSIKVIQSYEHIELPHGSNRKKQAQLPSSSTINQPKTETTQKQQQVDGIALASLMLKMREENEQLRKQNSHLKNQNASLREDNQILKQRCQKWRSQRKVPPSSSKKYKELDLNSQLLSEIVDLQAELSDNRHDLQLMVSFINSLSFSKTVPPQEITRKMMALRTIAMH